MKQTVVQLAKLYNIFYLLLLATDKKWGARYYKLMHL